MPDVSFENLLVVCALAVLAPLVVGFWPRLRIPAVVLEIVAGILVGPAVLGWVRVDLPLQILALLGLAFLLFLAGLEIDLHRLRGRVLTAAVLGYLLTLALGLGTGAVFAAAGWVQQPLLLAIAVSATSLGLVVPVLRDAGQAASSVGQSVIAAATVADFAAHGLHVTLECRSCGGVQVAPLDVLDATLGPDFDLVAHYQEVGRQLYCPVCSEPRPVVLLETPLTLTDEESSEPLRRHA